MARTQTDVLSVTRSTSGVLVASRARLKGLYFESPVDSAGFIDMYDSATSSTGSIRLSLDLVGSDRQSIRVPGEGILFSNGIYLFISGGNTPSITIFYG